LEELYYHYNNINKDQDARWSVESSKNNGTNLNAPPPEVILSFDVTTRRANETNKQYEYRKKAASSQLPEVLQ